MKRQLHHLRRPMVGGVHATGYIRIHEGAEITELFKPTEGITCGVRTTKPPRGARVKRYAVNIVDAAIRLPGKVLFTDGNVQMVGGLA